MEPTRWYPSKVDWWLAAILLGVPAGMGALVMHSALGGEWAGALIGGGSLAFLALIYAGLLWPMRYGFTDDTLVIQAGRLRSRVPLAEITTVTPTRNPLNSPALSLDRLEVCYRADPVYQRVSPADRDGFLDELATRSGLRRDGDRLVR